MERCQFPTEAIDAAPCHIAMGEAADEILGRPAFPSFKARIEVDLIVLSVSELGLGDQAPLAEIYTRATALGFALCPAEVGPELRLSYLDQPVFYISG